MTLYFDPRGHDAIRQELGVLAEEKLLASGDCFWWAEKFSIGIELKSPQNLMSAVVQRNEETGFSQLYFQLQKLTDFYDIPVLLIYGVYTPTREGKVQVPGRTLSWSYSSLELILFDAWAKGVYPVKVSSARAATLFIRALYAYSHGKGRKLELRKAKLFSYGGKSSAALTLLCSLPDINLVLGQRLLSRFGTPLAVFNASQEELQEIEGIGKVKAQSIYDCLRKEAKDGRQEEEG